MLFDENAHRDTVQEKFPSIDCGKGRFGKVKDVCRPKSANSKFGSRYLSGYVHVIFDSVRSRVYGFLNITDGTSSNVPLFLIDRTFAEW